MKTNKTNKSSRAKALLLSSALLLCLSGSTLAQPFPINLTLPKFLNFLVVDGPAPSPADPPVVSPPNPIPVPPGPDSDPYGEKPKAGSPR